MNRMENLSKVFQKLKRKKTHEEIEFDNSIQDYYCLLVVEKCLEKCLNMHNSNANHDSNAYSDQSLKSIRNIHSLKNTCL